MKRIASGKDDFEQDVKNALSEIRALNVSNIEETEKEIRNLQSYLEFLRKKLEEADKKNQEYISGKGETK